MPSVPGDEGHVKLQYPYKEDLEKYMEALKRLIAFGGNEIQFYLP